MSSNLKRGGDADAASPATKRASLAPDLSPPPTDIKQSEMPVFNIKRFIPSKWRDMIPSGDDLEVEGFSFSTEDPHMRRVFEFAVRAHEAVKCSGSGAAGRKGVSLCAFCSAAGPGFSFEGDPSKSKIIPLSLYAEVMKTYVPCAQDFIASFPEEADLAIGDTKLTRLDETDYFFDGLFAMWYCSKRYPDFAVLGFGLLLHGSVPAQQLHSQLHYTTENLVERHVALDEARETLKEGGGVRRSSRKPVISWR